MRLGLRRRHTDDREEPLYDTVFKHVFTFGQYPVDLCGIHVAHL
jgi:hypothetical protein